MDVVYVNWFRQEVVVARLPNRWGEARGVKMRIAGDVFFYAVFGCLTVLGALVRGVYGLQVVCKCLRNIRISTVCSAVAIDELLRCGVAFPKLFFPS